MMSQLKDVFKLFIIIALVAVGWGISGILIIILTPEEEQKPPKILMQIESPNNQNIAYVYEHNCGATCGFNTFITINNKKTPFKMHNNIVFQKDGYPNSENLKITWSNEKKVLIEYKKSFGEKVFTKLALLNDIEILYDEL